MSASLNHELEAIGSDLGADLIGFTTYTILRDSPPSGDPRYLLPSANSVISFAVALDPEDLERFIGKQAWRPHCENRKSVDRRLYEIGDGLTFFLHSRGYEAVTVDVNNNYRPEEGAADVTEMTEFHPEFSHRYAAVASGVGRLGWSGNLLTKKYGANVELGSVITSARLSPSPTIPDGDHPCDRCKMCAFVCPVEMIDLREEIEVTVAGITERIARKKPNTRCWIGCTGYEGLSGSGTWSNWSPFRLGEALPGEKDELDELCISLQKKDPQMRGQDNAFTDFRRVVFDPDWFYNTVCGFCRAVCRPQREERVRARRVINTSGFASLSLNGDHIVAPKETETVDTPFGVRVVVPSAELRSLENPSHGDGRRESELSKEAESPRRFPLDRETIRYLREIGERR